MATERVGMGMLFQSAEVREVCSAIRMEAEKLNKINPLGAGSLVRDIAVQNVRKESRKVEHSVRVERLSPDQIALAAMSNAALDELTYGNCFIYRGTLSARGVEFKAVWTWASNEMVRRGFDTLEALAEDTQNLEQFIRESG